MDSKDYKILALLKKNAKLSTKEISKKTLVPITTVHNRIKKFEKSGIIKGYTVILDDKKLETLSAYILVTVNYNLLKEKGITQHELAKRIRFHELVESTSMITGAHDILIKIRVKNVTQMDDFVTQYLRTLDGVEKSQTLVILNEI